MTHKQVKAVNNVPQDARHDRMLTSVVSIALEKWHRVNSLTNVVKVVRFDVGR